MASSALRPCCLGPWLKEVSLCVHVDVAGLHVLAGCTALTTMQVCRTAVQRQREWLGCCVAAMPVCNGQWSWGGEERAEVGRVTGQGPTDALAATVRREDEGFVSRSAIGLVDGSPKRETFPPEQASW